MSTALRKVTHATQHTFTVAAGQATTVGELVVLASDTTVQDAGGASDLGIGIAKITQTAGLRVDVWLFGPVIPVAVGTGDATRGTKAVAVADGWTDAAAHDSDGTANASQYGVFMQSGTAGQTVGMMIAVGNRGTS